MMMWSIVVHMISHPPQLAHQHPYTSLTQMSMKLDSGGEEGSSRPCL